MPTSKPSFADSQRYQPSDPVVGQSIAKDTYLSGRINLLWPVKSPNELQIRFAISAKYPTNVGNSDYVSDVAIVTEKWKINITLLPTPSSLKSGQTAQEVVKAEYDNLLPYLGSEVKISSEGLKVTKIIGKELELEGSGARTMWTEKRGTWTVFQEATQSSTTPSWLEADPISPPSSGPPIRTAPQAGPSHFRPITSHLPQQLNLRPTNSPTKRKRSISPAKRPEYVTRAPVPAVPKKVIELGNGKNRAFTRLTNGFGDTTALRESSSIGDALAGSSPTSLETAPQAAQDHIDPPVTAYTQRRSVSLDVPPDIVTRQPLPEAAMQAPVKRARPTSRAEAEAAARLEGQKRFEQQQAQQRAEREAATVLERGLKVTDMTYTPIKNIRVESFVNIIGVVVSVGAVNPPQGRRPDPILSVVFTDPSVYKGEGAAAEDLVVGIFRKSVAELPVRLVRGTPILFRRVKATEFNDKVKGSIFTGTGSWTYLMDGKLQHSAGDVQPALEKAEVDRLSDLGSWWKTTTKEMQTPGPRAQLGGSSPAGESTKMSLLGDARDFQFFDAVFKILHVNRGLAMHFELYVTDGSVSPIPLRNFHGVIHPHIPSSAIYCLNIKDEPPANELSCYQKDNIIRLGNIRAKIFNGELELIWANLLTESQASQGWRRRRPYLIPAHDPQSLAIEKRLGSLKKAVRDGTNPEPSLHKVQNDDGQYIQTQSEVRLAATDDREMPLAGVLDHSAGLTPLTFVPPTTTVSPNDVPMATHLLTTFVDPIQNKIQTIEEVLSNRTFPNKFRVKARVKSIHARGLPGKETFVQKHCKHCKRAITKTMHCQSCQDVNMKSAAWCYRFIVILEDEHTTIPVLIADHEAHLFLPSLPPMSSSTNPNDIRKTGHQIAAASKKVVEILQGGAMDSTPKGYSGLNGEKDIVVYKAFGMTSL